MPSQPYARSLNRLRRAPKPVTARQVEFLAQKAKNLAQTGRARRRLQNQVQSSTSTPSVPQDPDAAGAEANVHEDFDDGPRFQPEGPEPPSDEEETEILDTLQRAHYDATRLEHENRWSQQCHLMFPTYLRCRELTSEWGDEALWNHDFKGACSCPESIKRSDWVDMVDILSRKKVKVDFCDCKSDPVRLVELGYIGGSPVNPRTAFSIRLLRQFHVIWKHGAVRIQAFVRALDEYLDAHNPLILTTKSQQPRDWRAPFTAASDAYRTIITILREREFEIMEMDTLDRLAANCPRCFGPPVTVTRSVEPDVIVCLDGNFQHRRHAAASVPIPGYNPPNCELFLPVQNVEKMAEKLTGDTERGAEEEVHPCSEQHTAANDVRGKSHWGGCDDTGLLGMGCRHDHCLMFVNIRKSGEKSSYALALIEWILKVLGEAESRNQTNKLGILYDIGCNLEKGILKRDIFAVERELGRVKLGTSVFHAYVHEWGCQLNYNPRLNEGWGLSDGEGMERIWSFLSPLVRPNRYSSSQHRLQSLNLRSLHHNQMLRMNAVKSMTLRGTEVRKRLVEATDTLSEINREFPTHTTAYMAAQWERQKEMQGRIITESAQDKREQLMVLLELEEEVIEARDKLELIQTKRPRMRTGAERAELLNLPRTLTLLEQKVNDLARELGSEEFLNLTGTADARAKLLLTVQLAKSQLYEAKVGVVENQRRAQLHTGTSDQAWINQLRLRKKTLLKRKYKTYHRHASNYNTNHRPAQAISDPTFDEIEAMPITDSFWDLGVLSHPDEPWATDKATRRGISAYLVMRGAKEEMGRMAREVRQLIQWALDYQIRIDNIKLQLQEENEPSEAKLLYLGLVRSMARLWMFWKHGMEYLVTWSSGYFDGSELLDGNLMNKWRAMSSETSREWARIVNMPSLIAQRVENEPGNVEEVEMERDLY